MAATKRKRSLRRALDQTLERVGSVERQREVARKLGTRPEDAQARLRAELPRSTEPRRAALTQALDQLARVEREAMQRIVLREGRNALTQLAAELERAKGALEAASVEARIVGGWRNSVFGDSAQEAFRTSDYGAKLNRFLAETREERDALTTASDADSGRSTDPLTPVAHTLSEGGFAHDEIARLLVGDKSKSARNAVKVRLFRFRNRNSQAITEPQAAPGPITVRDLLTHLSAPLGPTVAAGRSIGAQLRSLLALLGSAPTPGVTKPPPEDS